MGIERMQAKVIFKYYKGFEGFKNKEIKLEPVTGENNN